MTLRFYNTLTRSLEPFEPLAPPAVTMYVCGPTVYDEPHIGHARSAYIFDMLSRYLEFKKFQVRFIRNVTDVDDKIIQKANETGQSAEAVAELYLERYHDTIDRLGIGRPTEEPRATQHVTPDMTDFISKLLISGVAYEAGGDVYFAVRKFPDYGKLSNRTLDELQAGARVEPGEHPGPTPGAGKQDPLDFALWKAAKPGEPSWNSPWGKGRPGWHIECSTMSTTYLGDAFDIHGGGVDLVFPHHENEIAQAHAVGKPFARTWIHNGLLTAKGEKMSKSLGNFITVDQALAEVSGEADVLKMFFLGTHYRSPIDYSSVNIRSAGQRFDALDSFLLRVDAESFRQSLPKRLGDGEKPQEIGHLEQRFERAMDDDLNTPEALAVFDQLAGHGNQWLREHERQPLKGFELKARDALPRKIVLVADTILTLGEILGLTFGRTPITEMVSVLVREREEARKRGDFTIADQKRKLVEEQGYIIEDTRQGPIVRRKR